jgi:hypothetical protein
MSCAIERFDIGCHQLHVGPRREQLVTFSLPQPSHCHTQRLADKGLKDILHFPRTANTRIPMLFISASLLRAIAFIQAPAALRNCRLQLLQREILLPYRTLHATILQT